MTKCTSRWGHNYQPRHDNIPPPNALDNVETVSVLGMIKIIEAMTKQIYVHDICTRCGDVIQRTSQP